MTHEEKQSFGKPGQSWVDGGQRGGQLVRVDPWSGWWYGLKEAVNPTTERAEKGKSGKGSNKMGGSKGTERALGRAGPHRRENRNAIGCLAAEKKTRELSGLRTPKSMPLEQETISALGNRDR